MKIAIIDNYDSFVYNLVRYVREIEGVEVQVFRNDKVDYEVLFQADGILLSPGPGIPSEAGDLLKVIAVLARSKSILGVCLGHQAIAEHFGATLKQSHAPIHGKSSKIQKVGSSVLLKNVEAEFEVARYHSWIVQNPLPEELVETASFESQNMSFQHKSLPIYGVQFHPESILTPDGRTMIGNWVRSVSTGISTALDTRLDSARCPTLKQEYHA